MGSFGRAVDRLDFGVIEVRLILNTSDEVIEDKNLVGTSSVKRISGLHH